MLALALKSFRGRYGLIRAGTTFNCAPGYFEALLKNGWVKAADAPAAPPPAPTPSKNRQIPEAPKRAGKSGAATATRGGKSKSENTGSENPSAPPPVAGGPLTSRSLRRDLRSRVKIALGSASGASSPSKPENPPAE